MFVQFNQYNSFPTRIRFFHVLYIDMDPIVATAMELLLLPSMMEVCSFWVAFFFENATNKTTPIKHIPISMYTISSYPLDYWFFYVLLFILLYHYIIFLSWIIARMVMKRAINSNFTLQTLSHPIPHSTNRNGLKIPLCDIKKRRNPPLSIIKEWNFWPLVPYSALLENILYFLYPLPGNSLKTKNN